MRFAPLSALASALALACSGGAPVDASAPDSQADAGRDAPPPPDAPGETPSLGDVVSHGDASIRLDARRGYGVLRLRLVGTRSYALETTRDESQAPSRRFVVREGDRIAYQLDEQVAELFTDFAVHASGDVTLGVERLEAERDAYDLVRLSPAGAIRTRAPLPCCSTLPDGDLVDLPHPAFRMKSRDVDALTDGWLRLEGITGMAG